MREESESTRVGVDIIQDRMTFAANVLSDIAILRDKFISLANQLSSVQSKAKREYEVERAGHHVRPAAAAPTAKRPASTAAGSSSGSAGGGAGDSTRRVQALKAWNSAKQESQREEKDKSVYVSVEKKEVVTVVREDDPWLEVEKADGSRGLVPMQLSSGGPRFEDIEEEAPAPPAPVESSEDEAPQEVFGSGDGLDVGDEMTMDMAGRTTPPPASDDAREDEDLTPGRPGAPILIDQSAIGAWVSHEHLKYTALVSGEHAGSILWWDGAETYKLAGQPDGQKVRIRSA